MNNQDIKNALGEMEPEEGAQIALDYLRSIGRVVKVWERGDLLSMAEQDPDYDALSDEDKERLIDTAEESSFFQGLDESNEYDHEMLSQAYDEAYAVVVMGVE